MFDSLAVSGIVIGMMEIVESDVSHLSIHCEGEDLTMNVCEDYVFLSCMNASEADVVSESICNTKVG